MSSILRPALVLLLIFTLLTGVVYPLVVTGIAQVIFPHQSNGSLITSNDKTVGSELIGQQFDEPQYFWGRISSTGDFPYNAFNAASLTGSSGSNYGPTNPVFIEMVQARIDALHTADPSNTQPIPVDLVTSSGSGLDPNISVAAAEYQIPRVARARGMSEADMQTLVDKYTQARTIGFLGEPRVNVLRLNLALDGIQSH
jgi:potassium-transporting ATPase KdpC subunit